MERMRDVDITCRRLRTTVVAAIVAIGLTIPAAASAATTVRNHADVVSPRHPFVTTVKMHDSGELLVDVTARAPGVSWQLPGSESAVVQIFVDGRFVTDDVVMEAQPITRSF